MGYEQMNKIVVLGCDASYPLGEFDWKGGEDNAVGFYQISWLLGFNERRQLKELLKEVDNFMVRSYEEYKMHRSQDQ